MQAERHPRFTWLARGAVIGLISALAAGMSGCESKPTRRAGEAPHRELLQREVLPLRPASTVPIPTELGAGGGSLLPAESEPDAAPPLAPRTAAPPSPGAPAPGCVQGWTTPARGSSLRKAALDMIRSGPEERFVVVEMRYFLGPEDAEVIRPQREIERWYVKAYSKSKPERRQRWLVRRARVGRGVDAVAPFDSVGYGPNTWRRIDALDESLADPFQRPCNQAEPGEKCMGLPREVLGCLDGT